jgi:hypothetical protein
MNSKISDIALDLGPFALDLEFEGGKTNDCRVTNVGRDRARMRIPAETGNIQTEQSLDPLYAPL